MIHATIKISKQSFEEVSDALKSIGLWNDEWTWANAITTDSLALTIEPVDEKPSALRLALQEGLKKDGPATKE